MRLVGQQQEKSPKDWELIIIGCRMCGRIWKIETKEEAEAYLTMWGMGAFAYMMNCPNCDTKLAHEVPLLPHEETLYKYIRTLEQRIEEKESV